MLTSREEYAASMTKFVNLFTTLSISSQLTMCLKAEFKSSKSEGEILSANLVQFSNFSLNFHVDVCLLLFAKFIILKISKSIAKWSELDSFLFGLNMNSMVRLLNLKLDEIFAYFENKFQQNQKYLTKNDLSYLSTMLKQTKDGISSMIESDNENLLAQMKDTVGNIVEEKLEMEDDHRPTVNGSYLPCQRQRDPSTFSGDGNINPGQWLKEYERVSKYNRWDETMRLANVVFYLNGTAGR
ncbi:hypothetical protein LAZ67_4003266 [Cordylochernes scorpioides]|uniref:Uncharacterized protein n=1 Tax=Cordylochernes scorpioides TaxID=51811 RepID=A0ABY6KI74_9ARAC|nr:hypothetical protein LAZ67_4003266 [Cordylochernes scorpioides]